MEHRLVKMDQDPSNGSMGTHRGQTGKARAVTRSQVPQGPKASQGGLTVMDGGGSLSGQKSLEG